MAALQFVSEPIAQRQLYSQRTREPNLEDIRTPAGITPLPLEFLQSWFTWGLGPVLFYVGVHKIAILVFRGTKIRPKFRPAFIKRYRVPEVPNAAIGHGEWKTVGDQADGIDRVPI